MPLRVYEEVQLWGVEMFTYLWGSPCGNHANTDCMSSLNVILVNHQSTSLDKNYIMDHWVSNHLHGNRQWPVWSTCKSVKRSFSKILRPRFYGTCYHQFRKWVSKHFKVQTLFSTYILLDCTHCFTCRVGCLRMIIPRNNIWSGWELKLRLLPMKSMNVI